MSYSTSLLKAYKKPEVVRQYFKNKLPQVKNTLAASEKILRAFGLIRSEWEYKDNLVAMKCISHLLDRFEAEKYLKVINGNIYYQREQKNIDSFKLIYNTIAQITPFLHKDVKIPDFEEFQRRCEGKCIKSVNDLNNITELPHWGKLRHKGSLIVSPFLNRAAKDIAASILLFWEHQHIFEKTAGKWVDPNNEALVKRAKNFQQVLDYEISNAKTLSPLMLQDEFLPRRRDIKAFDYGLSDRLNKLEKEELLVRFFRERLEAGKGVYAYKWTFVISDLHLLDYMHRDIFDLLRLIHIVKKVNGMLIINGDLLDLWREKDIFKIISKNQILFEALKAVKVFYVTGNHDSKVSALAKKDLWGIEIDSRFYDHENRIFVLHGNIFDKWNAGKGAIIGEQVTDFAKFLEDAFGEKTTKWLEVTRKKFSTQKGWEEEKVERIMDGIDEIILFAAREEAKRKPLNPEPFTEDRPLTVVIGHYHFPGDSYAYKEIEKRAEEKYGKKVRVIFSGSWFGRDSYAGEVVCFGKERNTGDMLTSTFIWQYPVAQELAALYSKDWKEHSLPM